MPGPVFLLMFPLMLQPTSIGRAPVQTTATYEPLLRVNMLPGMTKSDGQNYGLKIAAPVVALLSSSICAFAASFSA